MSPIDTTDLMRVLKEHLTLEVGARSNDPNDDTRSVSLWWCDENGDEKICETDL